MEAIMLSAFIADLLIVFGIGILGCVRLKKSLSGLATLPFAAGCIAVFASSVLLLKFLAGPILFGDCSSTAASHIAILWIARWNPLGPLLALAGLVLALFDRGWIRIAPILSSLFLISFGLFLHKLVEMR